MKKEYMTPEIEVLFASVIGMQDPIQSSGEPSGELSLDDPFTDSAW